MTASSPPSNRPVPHIVLVGMMGAGKTTVGAALARRREWEFFDSDAQVEARAGKPVAEIFAADGEHAFRVLESQALVDALATDRPAVIAAAGGAVLDPANRRLLSAHRPVVWLRAEAATLADHLGDGIGRPLLEGDPAGPAHALKTLVAEREPRYDEVADIVVDVDGLSSSQVIDAVEVALRDEGPARG